MKILESSATIVQIVKIQYPRVGSVASLQTIFGDIIEVRAYLKLCPGKSTDLETIIPKMVLFLLKLYNIKYKKDYDLHSLF